MAWGSVGAQGPKTPTGLMGYGPRIRSRDNFFFLKNRKKFPFSFKNFRVFLRGNALVRAGAHYGPFYGL